MIRQATPARTRSRGGSATRDDARRKRDAAGSGAFHLIHDAGAARRRARARPRGPPGAGRRPRPPRALPGSRAARAAGRRARACPAGRGAPCGRSSRTSSLVSRGAWRLFWPWRGASPRKIAACLDRRSTRPGRAPAWAEASRRRVAVSAGRPRRLSGSSACLAASTAPAPSSIPGARASRPRSLSRRACRPRARPARSDLPRASARPSRRPTTWTPRLLAARAARRPSSRSRRARELDPTSGRPPRARLALFPRRARPTLSSPRAREEARRTGAARPPRRAAAPPSGAPARGGPPTPRSDAFLAGVVFSPRRVAIAGRKMHPSAEPRDAPPSHDLCRGSRASSC